MPLAPNQQVQFDQLIKAGAPQEQAMSAAMLVPTGITAPAPTSQPNISPSFPQSGQADGPATNSAQQSLDGIKSQAQGVQDLLNQKKVSETKTRTLNTGKTNDTSFRGILETLLGKSNPTNEQERARKEMENISAGNKAIGDNAAAISKQYSDEIARIGGIGAGQMGQMGRGTTNVAYGNAMTAQNMASARMQSLAEAQAAALKGTEQQLTAQEQQANAFNPSLQASLTQQQQGIQGVSNAANYAQPVQVPYSNQFIDPRTGQSAGGAGMGGYAGYKSMEQTFDIAGQYPDAGFQYNPNLTPQQNLQNMQMAQQGSPTYQRGTYGVPGATNFSEASTQETARRGFDESYQAYQEIDKQKAYADERTDSLLNVMSQYGINENDVRKGNEIEIYLRKQFGDEGVVAYQTALAEAQRAYSSLLTIGGGTIPTEATAASNIILNPNSTPKQALAAIKQLKAAGEQRLRTQGSQATTYYNQMNTGTQGGGSTGGGTGWDAI
jgi:hypothetical protein